MNDYTLDDIMEIGEISGEKYYYGTATSAQSGDLYAIAEMGYYGSLEDLDEVERAQEIELVKKDREKYQEMAWKDKDMVLNLFSPID